MVIESQSCVVANGLTSEIVVPGAGLEPATFGCLRHFRLGLCAHRSRRQKNSRHLYPMSPTRYQLRHPGNISRQLTTPFEHYSHAGDGSGLASLNSSFTGKWINEENTPTAIPIHQTIV